MTHTDVQRGPLWGHTPASQQRRREILLAGKSVFFREGYAAASMDKIAAVAGATKRTVYDHFGSKEALFAEVIAFGSRQFVELLPAAADLPAAPEAGLRAFLSRLGELVCRPDIVRFQRLIIAQAESHPDFSRILYDTAFKGVERVLADYLAGAQAAGRVSLQDAATSARIAIDLALSGARIRALMGVDGEAAAGPEPAMIDLAIRLALGGSAA